MVQPEPSAVFHALADPARCAIVARLAGQDLTVAELAAPFAMSLQGVRKHLAVLESAGLIETARQGRARVCALAPRKLVEAATWLESRSALWRGRLDRLSEILAEETNG